MRTYAVGIVSEDGPNSIGLTYDRQIIYWITADSAEDAETEARARHAPAFPDERIVNIAAAPAPDWLRDTRS